MNRWKNTIHRGDCLEVMQHIPDGSIDSIICDLPYGMTACSWDNVIPFEPLWEQYNRIIKDNGAIVLFGSEPFSSHLRMSNIKNYKYDWIWEKTMGTGMAQSSYMPMKYHEIISIFVNNSKPTFNKILADRNKDSLNRAKYKLQGGSNLSNNVNIGKQPPKQYNPIKVNPKSVLKFKSVPNTPAGSKSHPTQKPVALLEYLIRTYTSENETVLDNTAGSFTTAIACIKQKRNYIMIEKDKHYFEIGKKRIAEQMYLENQRIF